MYQFLKISLSLIELIHDLFSKSCIVIICKSNSISFTQLYICSGGADNMVRICDIKFYASIDAPSGFIVKYHGVKQLQLMHQEKHILLYVVVEMVHVLYMNYQNIYTIAWKINVKDYS